VKELGRGTDLRTILLVGGDSLEERSCSVPESHQHQLISEQSSTP
jgi:hypothetical protein